MKRFLRLNDGYIDTHNCAIEETEAENEWGGIEKAYLFTIGKDTYLVRESEIWKQEDNIKDLCDLFIYEREGHKSVYKNLSTAKRELDNEQPSMDGRGSVYGAIWVHSRKVRHDILAPICEFDYDGVKPLPWGLE